MRHTEVWKQMGQCGARLIASGRGPRMFRLARVAGVSIVFAAVLSGAAGAAPGLAASLGANQPAGVASSAPTPPLNTISQLHGTDDAMKAVTTQMQLNQPVVGIAATPSGNGYWLVSTDGGIFSFGDAAFHGSTGGIHLNQPIVGIAGSPSGQGYYQVASDGGIFSFGDAAFHGSTGAIRLNQPITAMAATPSGLGYWLVARDGGLFAFGDATFHGSTGGFQLLAPIVGMATTPSGQGYWLLGADGSLFSFGDAKSFGSTSGMGLTRATVGIAPTPSGQGYWIATSDGSVFAFGDAHPFGSAAGVTTQQVVGIAALPKGQGYLLAGSGGALVSLPTASGDTGVVAASGPYTWISSNPDGSPMRFNPCQPVHYVTNLTSAPPSALADIQTALARIGGATGITFVNDGPTGEFPSGQRPAYQPAAYGKRWAPVLIAWARHNQADLLPGGDVVGEGGSTWVTGTGLPGGIFVTGQVAIDADVSARLAAGFGSGLTVGQLLLHELGHVMGLGHVQDSSQIMYPSMVSHANTAYGGGDLAGLSRLGASSGCLPTPAPQ